MKLAACRLTDLKSAKLISVTNFYNMERVHNESTFVNKPMFRAILPIYSKNLIL